MMKKCTDYRLPIVGTIVRAQVICRSQVLLVQTRRSVQNNAWEYPGGTLKENEFIEDGVVRELREETGINPEFPVRPIADVDRVTPLRTRWNYIYFELLLDVFPTITIRDTSEVLQADWFPMKRLPKLSEEMLFMYRQLPEVFQPFRCA